jgi:glycerol-3-phosphate O-acyltransferase / dihydroxyacetone phosphate acyltransferase
MRSVTRCSSTVRPVATGSIPPCHLPLVAMRRPADATMGALAGLLVRIFFRRIEVEGGDGLASSTPTVLVANHQNGLVDGLLLMATLPRYPRFLGKSTLFRILPLWPFLKLAGVVPVYRAKDGVPTSRNTAAFRTCQHLLAHGALVALFPEGISHDEPELQPLKTGGARIALAASVDDGTEGVVFLPVGLAYDAKARFRSRALVRIGAPKPVDGWAEEYRRDDHRAVQDLTGAMADEISALSPSYSSWLEAETLAEIAEVIARPLQSASPTEVTLAERERVAKALGHADVFGDQESTLSLRRAYAQYAVDLGVVGLTDAQLAANYQGGRLRLLLIWSLAKIVVGAPFAAVGALIHAIPYQIIKRVAKIPTNEGMKATVKLLGCFAAFTLLYAGLGVGAAVLFGPVAGLIAGVGAPSCGYVAVRFSERVKRLGGAVAGYRAARRATLSTVRQHRRDVITAAAALGLEIVPTRAPAAE